MLSVIAIAGGGLFGAGAFSQVQAERTVSVNAVGDADAYLQLTPDSSYAQNNNSELELTLDELNGNATTSVKSAFLISVSDAASDNYQISIDDTNESIGSDAMLEFMDGEDSLTSGTSTVTAGGEGIAVEIVVDLTGSNDASNIPESITIEANEVTAN